METGKWLEKAEIIEKKVFICGACGFKSNFKTACCPKCRTEMPGPSFDDYVKEALSEILPGSEKNGQWELEIYPAPDDRFSDQEVTEILKSEDPMQTLFEKLDYGYEDQACQNKMDLIDQVALWLDKRGITYDKETIEAVLEDLVYTNLPAEQFLDEEYLVDIFVDTGDGNYDFTCNAEIFPCYYGNKESCVKNESSLLWLARQQGYDRRSFVKFLKNGDEKYVREDSFLVGHGFLQTVFNELINLPSHMGQLVFLVKMTLRDLIALNEVIKKNNVNVDATCNKDCGHIVIPKKTMTGLFDSYAGGGSLLEIELEKDVELPIKYIFTALPDSATQYSIDETYGLIKSCWKDGVKLCL